jgi:hypothetical protein
MAITDEIRSQLPDKDKLKSEAANVIETAKDAGRQRLETGKDRAAEQVEKVAGVMEQASAQLKDSDLGSLADYAGQVASTIKSVSDNLRNRSIDDFLRDTQSLARQNPTLFLLGSVAIGVAISRFLKASAERRHEGYDSSAATRRVDDPVFSPEVQSSPPGGASGIERTGSYDCCEGGAYG